MVPMTFVTRPNILSECNLGILVILPQRVAAQMGSKCVEIDLNFNLDYLEVTLGLVYLLLPDNCHNVCALGETAGGNYRNFESNR